MQIFRKLADDRNIVSHVIVRDLFALPDAERSSDRLSKLQYELACGNVLRRETMTRWDLAADLDQRLVWKHELQSGPRCFFDYSNVVLGIDDDRELT